MKWYIMQQGINMDQYQTNRALYYVVWLLTVTIATRVILEMDNLMNNQDVPQSFFIQRLDFEDYIHHVKDS